MEVMVATIHLTAIIVSQRTSLAVLKCTFDWFLMHFAYVLTHPLTCEDDPNLILWQVMVFLHWSWILCSVLQNKLTAKSIRNQTLYSRISRSASLIKSCVLSLMIFFVYSILPILPRIRWMWVLINFISNNTIFNLYFSINMFFFRLRWLLLSSLGSNRLNSDLKTA